MNNENALHVLIGGKDILIRSSEVKEIVRPPSLTSVPMGPDHLLGLGNVHGQIVSVIDAGKCTSLTPAMQDKTAHTRILMLRDPVVHVGIWVDEIKRVVRISANDMAKSRSISNGIQSLEIDGKRFEMLDCSKLLHK